VGPGVKPGGSALDARAFTVWALHQRRKAMPAEGHAGKGVSVSNGGGRRWPGSNALPALFD
jgi:hypothetical protein